jgi:hypothetical protein
VGEVCWGGRLCDEGPADSWLRFLLKNCRSRLAALHASAYGQALGCGCKYEGVCVGGSSRP